MKIFHPEIEQLGDVQDLDAFRQVWAPRGWELLGEEEAVASDILGRAIRKLDDVKADEYPFLLAGRNLDQLAKSAKKSELEAAFRASFRDEPAPTVLADADAGKAGATDPAAQAAAKATTATDTNPKG